MAEFEIAPELALDAELQAKIVKPDWYGFEVEDVTDKESSKGDPMALVRAVGLDGDAKGVRVFINVMMAYPPIYIGFAQSMGVKLDPRTGKTAKFTIDNNTCKGKKFAGYLKNEEYEGEPVNRIGRVAPYEVLAQKKAALNAQKKGKK